MTHTVFPVIYQLSFHEVEVLRLYTIKTWPIKWKYR